MTAKKDLKRRIRERQQRTGESYVQARRAIVEAPLHARPAIEVDEMDDVTAEAQELGLLCSVSISRQLSAHVEPRTALLRLRDAVLHTAEDPALEVFRAVLLRGALPMGARRSAGWYEQLRTFIARARAGIGGLSDGGTMLALHVGSVMMLCQLGFGLLRPAHAPRVVLTTPAAATFGIEAIALRAQR